MATIDYSEAIISAVVTEHIMTGNNSFVVGRIVEICNLGGYMLNHRIVGDYFRINSDFEHVNGSRKGERFRVVGEAGL